MYRGLSGLGNLGNTCYMNSILSCLSHTALVFKGGKQCDVINAYVKLVSYLWKDNSPKAPVTFKKCMEKYFPGNNQEDSHEFLLKLLDIFYENTVVIGQRKIENKHLYKNVETSAVDIFRGQFFKKHYCVSCENISRKYEPFFSIDLQISKKEVSISRLIKNYFRREILYFTCDNCGCSEHEMDNEISILPDVLVLSLKRFSKKGKITTNIKISEHLDFSDYSRNENVIFNLKSMVCHTGGHYYSVIKVENEWFCFNDTSVTKLNREVDSSLPYILFYEKKSPDNTSVTALSSR